MVSKSQFIEGLLVAAGIILLSQSIGGITGLIFSGYAPMMIFGAVWSVLFISAGSFLLHQAYKRRKKRKAAEREATDLRTPIGLEIVTMQKSRDLRPLGISLIAYSSLIGGALAALIYGLSYSSVLQSTAQPMPEDLVSNPATSIVLGIASVLVGYGLLRRKRWGWKWGIVGLFVSIGLSVVYAFENPSMENVGVVAATDGFVLLMLYYLYLPHVKAYFGITSNNPLVRQEYYPVLSDLHLAHGVSIQWD